MFLLSLHTASCGAAVRIGHLQSIPSSSIDSCARVSDTTPFRVRGQTNRPRSRRLANRHSPSPSFPASRGSSIAVFRQRGRQFPSPTLAHTHNDDSAGRRSSRRPSPDAYARGRHTGVEHRAGGVQAYGPGDGGKGCVLEVSPLDFSAARSKSLRRTSVSSNSIALAAWSSTESAARTRLAAGAP